MESKVQSWQLVEHLFDASVGPERVDELIASWDAQMEQGGLNQPSLADQRCGAAPFLPGTGLFRPPDAG